jgi:hypothetical protein
VRFPRPRVPIVTWKTLDPPAGPGTTSWELLLLLVTNMRGGLLEAAAHRATEIVIREEDGREKTRGVEVVKLLPVRVTGVSKEREDCVLWDNVDGRESKSEAESAQSDCASILDR